MKIGFICLNFPGHLIVAGLAKHKDTQLVLSIGDQLNPQDIGTVPDNAIIVNSDRALAIMRRVYEPFKAPILVTDINSAELIKHAANSFLALKISYANAIAAICEASGADVDQVADGIGADKRIGRSFLDAGLGYGGSCFPKDVAAFISISEQIGEPFTLLKEVQRINTRQRERFVKRVRNTLWVLKEKRIAVWGLTFKPNTDDVRNSVAVDLVNDLIREGAYVTAYDPKGNIKIQELKLCPGVHLADATLEAVEEAEALVLATEWPDFAAIDMEEVLRMMHTPIVFDGRNLFNPTTMRDLGFQYYSIGRPSAKLIVDELPNRLVSRRDNSELTAKKLLPFAHKA